MIYTYNLLADFYNSSESWIQAAEMSPLCGWIHY